MSECGKQDRYVTGVHKIGLHYTRLQSIDYTPPSSTSTSKKTSQRLDKLDGQIKDSINTIEDTFYKTKSNGVPTNWWFAEAKHDYCTALHDGRKQLKQYHKAASSEQAQHYDMLVKKFDDADKEADARMRKMKTEVGWRERDVC